MESILEILKQGQDHGFHGYVGIGMIVTSVLTFFATLFIAAPYGRFVTQSQAWGPQVPAKISWFLMESPNVWWSLAGLLSIGRQECLASTPNLVLLLCFTLHYINRSFIYPLRIRNPKPMPLSVPVMAFTFCSVNGYLQTRWLTSVHVYPESWLQDWRFIAGVAVFFFGFFSNIKCDNILANLRKPGETGYKIPRGYLFELVTSANYFAEIVEWSGLALASSSLPAWAFVCYTFSNLAPRANSTHKWYLDKFKGEYPQSRKAIIPFIW